MENGQLQKVGKGKGGWIKVFFRKKTKQSKEASGGELSSIVFADRVVINGT